MRSGPAAQEHNGARNILRFADLAVRNRGGQSLNTSQQIHESAGHLRGKEARGYAVDKHVSRTKLDSQIVCQMDGGRFGCGIAKGCIVPQRACAEASYRCCDDDPGARLFRSFFLEEWRKPK